MELKEHGNHNKESNLNCESDSSQDGIDDVHFDFAVDYLHDLLYEQRQLAADAEDQGQYYVE